MSLYDDTRRPEHLGADTQELVARQRDTYFSGLSERKREAKRRLDILNERHQDLVAKRISETHVDPMIRHRIRKFISVAINPGKDITRAVACVYKKGVRRQIYKNKAKTRALQELNDESMMSVLAPMLNQYSWFVGPTLEIPVLRGGRLRRDLITTDKYDVALDPEDPLGAPVSAAWTWAHGESGQPVIVVLDREKREIWGMSGDTPIKVIPHGVVDEEGDPLFPGTIWRFDTPIDYTDWWGVHRNSRLVDATIECSFIYSLMNWVRKTQNRNQITYFGNLDKLQKSSKLDPEQALFAQIDDDDPTPEFKIHDLNTSPDNFIAHIMFIYRTMVESYGIPQSALTFDFSGQGTSGSTAPESYDASSAMNLGSERLAQIRDGQIPYASEAEHSSQLRAIAVCEAGGHPNKKLPSLKDVADRFRLEWPDINKVENPSEQQSAYDWQLHRGLTTDVKIYQMNNPDLSEEEAEAEIIENLATQARLNDLKAKRMLDPASQVIEPDLQLLQDAEVTGAMGPMVRDQKVPPEQVRSQKGLPKQPPQKAKE